MSLEKQAPVCSWSEPILRVIGVDVAYDGRPVLRDLSLEVRDLHREGYQQGQVVGLLGPSGVGKTTLFHVLAGLQAPDRGEVLVEKEAIPVQKGMVGVVTQSYFLLRHRTVLGNLLVAGAQAGLSRKENHEKARGLLEMFGLAEHGPKYPAQLSGGQRQRVAIAQQFMCSDHFLLMDEPFSGLDLVAASKVISFIQQIAETDELKTFIIITHDIAAAIEVCDMICLLGRDRTPEGEIIPGARIQKTYNLVELGLAFREGVTQTPEFLQLLREIREIFPRL